MAEAITNGIAQTTATSVIVSVEPRQPNGAQRATVLDSTDSAVRLVEALMEAGCDSARVQTFSGQEIRVGIELNPTVALYDSSGGIIAAALAEAATSPLSPSAAVAPMDPSTEHSEPVLKVEDSPAAPQPTFHLRADRVVFACLWVVSLIVLLASLAVSLSRSEPREFVPAAPASEAVLPSPLDVSLAPLPNTDPSLPACAQGDSHACRCDDFATQDDAQRFYSVHPARTGHIADTDGDGVFCEWLPPALSAP